MFYPCSENKGADQLICVFVFAYAKSRFSHNEAQICYKVFCNKHEANIRPRPYQCVFQDHDAKRSHPPNIYIKFGILFYLLIDFVSLSTYKPRHDKPGFLGFRPGPTQTRLYSHRRWLEARTFGFRKWRDCTIYVAKTKGLISCAVTAQLRSAAQLLRS